MVRLIADNTSFAYPIESCFNSRDGAIDSLSLLFTLLSFSLVSIPEMVRLIVIQSTEFNNPFSGFNSRDGAIDSCSK